jgi:putative hydrolase of HD superfamily
METKNPPPASLLQGEGIHPVIRLFFETAHLKQLFRQGWLRAGRPVPKEWCESVADHSFSVALLALVLAQDYFPQLDADRVVKLALIHDVAEARIGDITPMDNIPEEQKLAAERKAMEELFEAFPNRDRYLALWEEQAARKTPEARLVHQIDKLEMVLQASVYEHHGANGLQEFYDYVRGRMREEPLREIFAELLEIREDRSETC